MDESGELAAHVVSSLDASSIGGILMAFKVFVVGPALGFLILLNYFHPILSLYECIFGGVVVGVNLCAWISYIFCAAAGGTSSFAIRVSYTFISMWCLYLIIKLKRAKFLFRDSLMFEVKKEIWMNVMIVLSAAYFWRVFFIHILYTDDVGSTWSGGSTWSDMSFHLNIINSYLFGQNKAFGFTTTPRSVIFAGSGLSYPFICDWQTVSAIASGAADVRWAIIIPSFMLMISFLVILFCFSRRFLGYFYTPGSEPQYSGIAFLSVLIFMTLSGIGGFTILRDRAWTWETAINHDSTQFTSKDDEIYWFHPICHILLPQRSALFAYPLLLLICSVIFHVTSVQVPARRKRVIFFVSGCLTGMLPLIHAHSLLCLAIILIPYALLQFKRSFSLDPENGLFLRWLEFGIPILLESLVQLPVYMDRLGHSDAVAAGSSSFITLTPIWRNGSWRRYKGAGWQSDVMNLVMMWGRGTGFFVPLALLGIFFLRGKNQKKMYFCFWLIFVAANVIQFQPWDKDNTKLFLIWTMICVSVVSLVIYRIWRVNSVLTKLLAIVLVISLILSGSMMLYRESTLWWQFMDKGDQEFGQWVAANTNDTDVFIVNDSHIHPVTNLAGKTAVVNMAGWVQSHGYPDMWGRYAEQRSILTQPDTHLHLFQKHKLSYIVKDWRLTKDHPDFASAFFASNPNVSLAFHNSKFTLYDVRKLSKP